MEKSTSTLKPLTSAVFPILSESESLQALADVRITTVHANVFTAVVYCLADIFPWGQQSKLNVTNINFPWASPGNFHSSQPLDSRATWAQWSVGRKVKLRMKFSGSSSGSLSQLPNYHRHRHSPAPTSVSHKYASHHQLSADAVCDIRKETLLVWLLRRLNLNLD